MFHNDDRSINVSANHKGRSPVIYECSNPGNIQFLDDFSVNNNTIPHNAFIIGNYAYISWYTEGLVVVDMSDSSDLKKHASYDTSPYAPGSGYEGAWGCYPFSPSGVVYISDRGEGLHILRVEGPAMTMAHQPLDNTEDQSGPYQMSATVSALESSNPVASVQCLYRTNGGSWQSFAMAPGSGADEWVGAFPGQDAPATVGYYLLAEAADGSLEWLPDTTAPGDLTFDFIVGRLETIYFNDFEGSTDEGFTHGGTGQDDGPVAQLTTARSMPEEDLEALAAAEAADSPPRSFNGKSGTTPLPPASRIIFSMSGIMRSTLSKYSRSRVTFFAFL